MAVIDLVEALRRTKLEDSASMAFARDMFDVMNSHDITKRDAVAALIACLQAVLECSAREDGIDLKQTRRVIARIIEEGV